jgi:tetratricopeptide (TPR) repeat protein
MRVEKTVFISYRRTNVAWALAVYQNLSKQGYDVFFDYSSINSGNFEQIIIDNIKSRAHFLVILTPSALERCDEPNDWLRREIETALDEKRNIVPVFFEGFNFNSPSISKYLTGKIANLSKYNGVDVPASYFDEAMARIQNRYLNIPLEMVIHVASTAAKAAANEEKKAANKEATVTEKTLSADEWLEKGLDSKDPDNRIQFYSEAIQLKPDYARAFFNRGNAYKDKGDFEGAIRDYSEAIRLKPDYADALYNRGLARKIRRDFEGAIRDYSEAIRLQPYDASAYNNRGNAYYDKKDYQAAKADWEKALELYPNHENARKSLAALKRNFLA